METGGIPGKFRAAEALRCSTTSAAALRASWSSRGESHADARRAMRIPGLETVYKPHGSVMAARRTFSPGDPVLPTRCRCTAICCSAM